MDNQKASSPSLGFPKNEFSKLDSLSNYSVVLKNKTEQEMQESGNLINQFSQIINSNKPINISLSKLTQSETPIISQNSVLLKSFEKKDIFADNEINGKSKTNKSNLPTGKDTVGTQKFR